MKKLVFTMVAGLLWINSNAQSATTDTAIVNFVTSATKGGLIEVNSGKLATQKGKSAEVKKFGAQMVADHTKANAELMAIVNTKNWTIPQPSSTVVALDAMLTKSSGKEFDVSYVNMMVKDHKKTVMLFEHAASSSPDPHLKAFAAKTLPVLKHHYMEIQQIGDKLGIAYDK